MEAVKAGRSVYFSTLADIVTSLATAEREGQLKQRLRYLCRAALLVVDEIGYLPVIPGGGNLFFQLVNARYEKGAMILTSNRGFAEWGEVFGDPVVATALLDRLLHHAVVIQIEGSSYRLRQHADLVPEHVRSEAHITPPLAVLAGLLSFHPDDELSEENGLIVFPAWQTLRCAGNSLLKPTFLQPHLWKYCWRVAAFGRLCIC